MKIEKLCLSLLLLACLSLTATAWRPLPTLEDANPCEAADFLLAQQDFEAARLLYLKLLETPSSRACAQAGLLRLAEAQEQAAAAEKARLANLPRPLVPSLNVVGVQRCPSLLGRWLNCGTRWIGWPALLLPLANTDPASLTPHNALPTLLINSENGQTLPARLGSYEQRDGRLALPIEVSGLDRANGKFSGSFDLLPEDKERGDFTLELTLRDSVLWALLTVLIGVYLSTLVRIYINKFLPAQTLHRDIQALRQEVQAKGFTLPLADQGNEFNPRLKHYTIVPAAVKRLEQLAADFSQALRNPESENLKASSGEAAATALYTRFAAERDLLAGFQDLFSGYLWPTHRLFQRAWNEAQSLRLPPGRIKLLELAEEDLYTPTPEDEPQQLGGPADLQQLKAGLSAWQERLTALADGLYRLNLCRSLAQKIQPSLASAPPEIRLMFYKAWGGAEAAQALLALDLRPPDLQTLVLNLDKSLAELQAVWAFLSPGRGEAVAPPQSLAVPAALELRGVKAPAAAQLTPLRLTAEYFYHWPNALSLVLAVAFALSTLYFGKTFGSPADYLAALAWGLGVDTATRTIPGLLSGLGIGKA